MTRSKAVFINGGSGRTLCAIPALEKLAKTDKDFIIVCESGDDFLKKHPELHHRVYSPVHKNLFNSEIKNRDVLTPEPYRVWEYYNQKCSIAEAFDIEINGRNSSNEPLSTPTIYLTAAEEATGKAVIEEVKKVTGKEKVVILQPFGRGAVLNGGIISDQSGRSISFMDTIELGRRLFEHYSVIVMAEFNIPFNGQTACGCGPECDEKTEVSECDTVKEHVKIATPRCSLRDWASIIKSADYFLGCDSVGQHIAHAVQTPSTVVVGSTYPINVSYVNDSLTTIIDVAENTRKYSPIRICVDEVVDLNNTECMYFDKNTIDTIINSIKV